MDVKENMHKGRMLEELASDVCNNRSSNNGRSHIEKLFADGAYDFKDNFGYLGKLNKDNTSYQGKKEFFCGI